MRGAISNRSDIPKVLVLLTLYEGVNWIKAQVDSILDQEYVDIKIIIHDDNSSDRSLLLIESEYSKNPNILLIKNIPGTGSAGQNFMKSFRDCDVSGFDYVALSDQDDIWLPGKLNAAINQLKLNNASGYSCSSSAFWESGQKKISLQSHKLRKFDYLFEGAGQGCTFVLNAESFSRVQNFCIDNEGITQDFYYHDWLIYLLLRSWGLKWYFDKTSWINYRQHNNNDTGARRGFLALKNRLNLIVNGWYRAQIIIAYRLSLASGDKSEYLKEFDSIVFCSDSLSRRLSLMIFVLRFSRRNLTDRVILGISALMGWI